MDDLISPTSKQINELRAYAKDLRGGLAKMLNDAAFTIELLSTPRPEHFGDCTGCKHELKSKLSRFEVCAYCCNRYENRWELKNG